MQYFSIKDIENLTGIKAHTLRIWEKRYHLVISKRKESNHRIFDNEDLKAILRISYLYETEFKISQIAKLSEEAKRMFSDIDYSTSKSTNAYILQLLHTIIDFDHLSFERILGTAIKQIGFEKAISEIAYGLLRRIGLLWLTDNLLPAQEHFATNIIRSKLIHAIDQLPKENSSNQELVLLFTPQKEFHEIPLLFAQWLFKRNGIKTLYLGVNISMNEISYLIKKRKITHCYYHVITNLTGNSLNEYNNHLLKKFPDQNIIVSGTHIKEITTTSPKLMVLKSLQEMIEYSAKFSPQLSHSLQHQ